MEGRGEGCVKLCVRTAFHWDSGRPWWAAVALVGCLQLLLSGRVKVCIIAFFFQRPVGELVGLCEAQKELWESGGGLSSDKRIRLFLCGKAGGCQLKYAQHLYS